MRDVEVGDVLRRRLHVVELRLRLRLQLHRLVPHGLHQLWGNTTSTTTAPYRV